MYQYIKGGDLKLIKEQVTKELNLIGLKSLNPPLFYNAEYGIRFEIGVGNVYDSNMEPRKEYIENALNRAMTIYRSGLKFPSFLVWKVNPQNEEESINLKNLFFRKIAPVLPHEELSDYVEAGSDTMNQTQFYWDLNKSEIPIDKVFYEIILGDIGGSADFVLSIYIVDVQSHVILQLYDDMGLDIVSYDKDRLLPVYKELKSWILDYDRKEIDDKFAD